MTRLTLLLLALAGCNDSALVEMFDVQAEEPPEIGTFFRVTRDGMPIRGLPDDAFGILEDGYRASELEARIELLPAPEAHDLKTLLLLDMSPSVTAADPDAFDDLLDAAKGFVERIVTQGPVAIASFDGQPELTEHAGFLTDIEVLQATLEGLRDLPTVNDSTNLYGPTEQAIALLEAQEVEEGAAASDRALLVFTDGRHLVGHGDRYPWTLETTTAAIEATEVVVYTVGLGSNVDGDQLRAIGRNGVFTASASRGLSRAFGEVADAIEAVAGSYYSMSYCSPARDGEHELRVAVDHRGLLGTSEPFLFDASGVGDVVCAAP